MTNWQYDAAASLGVHVAEFIADARDRPTDVITLRKKSIPDR